MKKLVRPLSISLVSANQQNFYLQNTLHGENLKIGPNIHPLLQQLNILIIPYLYSADFVLTIKAVFLLSTVLPRSQCHLHIASHNLICMHGGVVTFLVLALKAESLVSVCQIFLFTYMVAFNATSQL